MDPEIDTPRPRNALLNRPRYPPTPPTSRSALRGPPSHSTGDRRAHLDTPGTEILAPLYAQHSPTQPLRRRPEGSPGRPTSAPLYTGKRSPERTSR